MKKMGRKFLIGTAMAVSSAAFLAACDSNKANVDVNVCVYGPPEAFETESSVESGEITVGGNSGETGSSTDPVETTIDNNYNTTEEINADVYGPPEYWQD